MNKNLVLKLRYVGMLARIGHREYGFHVEDKDRRVRQVILTIDNTVFRTRQLMFQEAPDLCYQKLLSDLDNETVDAPIRRRAQVTEADVAAYRLSHPTARLRKAASVRPQ